MRLRGLKKKIFLKKGKLRKVVYERLNEPKTATEVAKELNKHRSAVSRVLLRLQEAGLVKCVNPKDDRFRHYVKVYNKRK